MTVPPGSVPARPPRVSIPGAALPPVAFLLVIGGLSGVLDGGARTVLSDIGTLLLTCCATAGCARAALRTTGRMRRGWTALALACGSWAVGQVVWNVYELGMGIAVPFPSIADVGYLGFPVLGLFGLIWLAPTSASQPLAATRRLLDALMISGAVTLLAWYVTLRSLGSDSVVVSAVSLAYPAGDLILLVAVVLTLAQTRADVLRWALLGAAMLAMTVSDVVFAHQSDDGTYISGSVIDWGWWLAFTLIAVVGALVGRGERPTPARTPRGTTAGGGLLPYLPVVGAVVVVVGATTITDGMLDPVGVTLVVVLVGLVLARQYVTVLENQRLTRTLRESQRQLGRLALQDPLTGLANRTLFLDRLGHALNLSARDGKPVSVVYVDLDGFKAVNDTLGHAMGDALLVLVARRLEATLRTSDTLARLGGDEFAVLVENGRPGGADAVVVGRALLDALRPPFVIDGRAVTVSASVGIASTDGDGALAKPGAPSDPATLLHRADVAMYAVKNTGKDDVLVHSPTMDSRNHRQGRSLESALTDAIESGEIRAVYQPVVDPLSGRIGAFEALARWTLDGTEIPPSTFVPAAERAGLSEHLTAVMLEQACAQLAAWSDALGHRRLRMAVNVDPTEFSDDSLPDRIQALVDRHRLYPAQLALEITEGALTNRQASSQDVMFRLREIGVRIALDDFGTGYSTLARLATIPLDTVKIDRFFVADIDHDVRRKRFLVGLFELTRHLGLRTVAEGVERAGQLRELQRLRCDLVQGHYIARPMTSADLTPLVLADVPIIAAELLGMPEPRRGEQSSRV